MSKDVDCFSKQYDRYRRSCNRKSHFFIYTSIYSYLKQNKIFFSRFIITRALIMRFLVMLLIRQYINDSLFVDALALAEGEWPRLFLLYARRAARLWATLPAITGRHIYITSHSQQKLKQTNAKTQKNSKKSITEQENVYKSITNWKILAIYAKAFLSWLSKL